jgi:hypothetical protein
MVRLSPQQQEKKTQNRNQQYAAFRSELAARHEFALRNPDIEYAEDPDAADRQREDAAEDEVPRRMEADGKPERAGLEIAQREEHANE